MGTPGSQGPAGPTGPTGPTGPAGAPGGALSYAAFYMFLQPAINSLTETVVSEITLDNPGTYIIGGTLEVADQDDNQPGGFVLCSFSTTPTSTLQGAAGLGLPIEVASIPSGGNVTLPLDGFYAVTTAPTTLYVICNSQGQGDSPNAPNLVGNSGTLTAIQVK